jgi:two-component system, NarL family, response regulator
MKTSQKSLLRVLIVDDHFMTRLGLTLPIKQQRDMTVIAEAGTGAEAVAAYREHTPDVVIMDYRLPDMDGPSVTRLIRREFPQARVLILSATETDEQLHQALRSGASGYLSKDTTCPDLLAALRHLHSGGKAYSESQRARAKEHSTLPELTPREVAILREIAQGTPNKEIARRLHFSESLIKQELVRLYQKLGAQDRAQDASLALKRGILEG